VRKEPLPGSRGRRGALALGFLGISLLLAVVAALTLLGPSAAGGGPATRAADPLEVAKLAFADRDFARAGNLLEELLKSDSKNVSARLLLGRALYEQGRLAAARETFSAILKEEKDNEGAVRGLAGTYEALNQPDLAAAWWQRAVALNNSKDPEPHKRLAQVLLKKGDHAGAMAALQQARAIDPKREDVEALFQEILTAQAVPGGPAGISRPGSPIPPGLQPPDPRTRIPTPQPPDPSKEFPRPGERSR